MKNLERRITALETATNKGFMVVILLPKETVAEARKKLNVPMKRRGFAFVPHELANV